MYVVRIAATTATDHLHKCTHTLKLIRTLKLKKMNVKLYAITASIDADGDEQSLRSHFIFWSQ